MYTSCWYFFSWRWKWDRKGNWVTWWRWLGFWKDTCKIETIIVDTVKFIPTLKSVRILSEKESRVKRDKVLASESKNLPLKEDDLVFIKVTWVVFPCSEWLLCKKRVSLVVRQVPRGLLARRRFDWFSLLVAFHSDWFSGGSWLRILRGSTKNSKILEVYIKNFKKKWGGQNKNFIKF